jgi:hypothetical protein
VLHADTIWQKNRHPFEIRFKPACDGFSPRLAAILAPLIAEAAGS